jgi:hypothetical protein
MAKTLTNIRYPNYMGGFQRFNLIRFVPQKMFHNYGFDLDFWANLAIIRGGPYAFIERPGPPRRRSDILFNFCDNYLFSYHSDGQLFALSPFSIVLMSAVPTALRLPAHANQQDDGLEQKLKRYSGTPDPEEILS